MAREQGVIGSMDFGSVIDDAEFNAALQRWRRLARFVYQDAVVVDAEVQAAARLGPLNLLRDGRGKGGRPPTDDEWQTVEANSQTIWRALAPEQRRRFLATQTPGWINWVIVAFVAAAIGSVLLAYFVLARGAAADSGLMVLGCFMVWSVALGATGAAASIGMNALSVQDDAAYDMSLGKFVWLRLTIGVVFGTVLTLVLGFPTFAKFMGQLRTGAEVEWVDAWKQAGLLVLPFVLGYSTSLVILVLNRLIEAVQTIFGKPPVAAVTVAPATLDGDGIRHPGRAGPSRQPQRAEREPREGDEVEREPQRRVAKI